jgi:hypothetical protein
LWILWAQKWSSVDVPAELASNEFENRAWSSASADDQGSCRGGNVNHKRNWYGIGTISLREESDAQVVPGNGDEFVLGFAPVCAAKQQWGK